MKLLFITQKVNKSDDVLGFVHNWLIVLAKKFESVIVICLEKGEYELPGNVSVLSLGKETGTSDLKYMINFFHFIWQYRQSYDVVLVHMNPVYVVLGGWFWRLVRKPVAMWYNHKIGDWQARLAGIITHRIFYTSPFSFFANHKKAIIMPAGIDTELFKKDNSSQFTPDSFLCLSRISPVKKIEQIIAAANDLQKTNSNFSVIVVGSPLNPEDQVYEKELHTLAAPLVDSRQIKFQPKIQNSVASVLYNQCEVFINATPTGSFDKTILEAMATEKLVIVSNQSFKEVLPPACLFTEGDTQDLAKKMSGLLALTVAEKLELGRNFRAYVCKFHNLELLVDKFYADFKNRNA